METQILKYGSLKLLLPVCLLESLCMLTRIQVVHFEVYWPRDQRSNGVGGIYETPKSVCCGGVVSKWDPAAGEAEEEQVWGQPCWRTEAV